MKAGVEEREGQQQVLTPQDIGWLLPNTTRPKHKEQILSETYEILTTEGEVIEYKNNETNNVFGHSPRDVFQDKETGEKYTILGLALDNDEGIVVRDKRGNGLIIPNLELLGSNSKYEKILSREPEGVSLQEAKEILGETQVFDANDVKKVWGVEIVEVPPIPFSKEDLEKAKEMGMFLILRVEKDSNGETLSSKRMEELLQSKLTAQNLGKIFYNKEQYQHEDFFIKEKLTFGWALTSGEVLPDSQNKNYVEQTKLLRDELKRVGWLAPDEEQECTDARLEQLTQLLTTDQNEAVRQLVSLKINQNHRLSFAEINYDRLSILVGQSQRILETNHSYSKSCSAEAKLVSIGYCDFGGALVDHWKPDNQNVNLGVSFS